MGTDTLIGGAGLDTFAFSLTGPAQESTYAWHDQVLDFEPGGRWYGDLVWLQGEEGQEFFFAGRLNGPLRAGAALPGGGDGELQLVYAQRGGNTFLLADTNDNGALDGSDFTVEFRGRYDFSYDEGGSFSAELSDSRALTTLAVPDMTVLA